MGDLSKNFSRWEFKCRCGCGADNIDMKLVYRLQDIRDVYGREIRINSGVRCKEHNADEGGASDSEHLTGEAADLRCENSRDRYELLYHTHEKFTRVGVAKDFIHVGISVKKEQDVTWVYA
jgi:uncharacterized protein YcbK (DUF882 family)